MRLELTYEWELEGDLAASVFLDLVFYGSVADLDLADELHLAEVKPLGVKFAMRGHSVMCGSESKLHASPAGQDLPNHLLGWLAIRFFGLWETNELLRRELTGLLVDQAVGKHFEPVAA